MMFWLELVQTRPGKLLHSVLTVQRTQSTSKLQNGNTDCSEDLKGNFTAMSCLCTQAKRIHSVASLLVILQLMHVYYDSCSLNPTFMTVLMFSVCWNCFGCVWIKLVILEALICDAIDGLPVI